MSVHRSRMLKLLSKTYYPHLGFVVCILDLVFQLTNWKGPLYHHYYLDIYDNKQSRGQNSYILIYITYILLQFFNNNFILSPWTHLNTTILDLLNWDIEILQHKSGLLPIECISFNINDYKLIPTHHKQYWEVRKKC